MADVTISQLNKGLPLGNNVLPYSNEFSTLGVTVSSLFQSVSCVGIGGPAKTGVNVGLVGAFNDPDIALAVKNPYAGLSTCPNATFYTDISANKRNFLFLFTNKSTGSWNSGNTISLVYGTLSATPGSAYGSVDGRSGDTPSFSIGAWGSGQQGIHISGNGNLGVNTANPKSKLHVDGDIISDGVTINDGITYYGRKGSREYYQVTQGKYRFTFPSVDFYGNIEIKAIATNYNQGTETSRSGRWVIPLRYNTAKTLVNVETVGTVYTNIYNSNGFGLIWNNVSGTISDLTIFNSGSNGPDACKIELEFLSLDYPTQFSLKNIFTRTAYTSTTYSTNPYA